MAFAQQLLLDSLSVHMWIISALSKELGIKKMDVSVKYFAVSPQPPGIHSDDWHSSLIYNILSINSLPLQLCLTDSVDSFKMEFLFKQTGLRNVLTALYCLKKKNSTLFYCVLCYFFILAITAFNFLIYFPIFCCQAVYTVCMWKGSPIKNNYIICFTWLF